MDRCEPNPSCCIAGWPSGACKTRVLSSWLSALWEASCISKALASSCVLCRQMHCCDALPQPTEHLLSAALTCCGLLLKGLMISSGAKNAHRGRAAQDEGQ